MNQKQTVLGIEFGSTRIKAVLLDREHKPIASGSHSWENSLIDGVWTYPLDEIHSGLQACFADLRRDVREKFGQELTETGAIGVSAMMHGYMAFDRCGKLLVPFRTWRNTMTSRASAELTELFGFHIPQRWTIAHLYQAILNGEEHVKDIDYLTTLAGYIHLRLSGQRLVGTGEASGIVPIDMQTLDYDSTMVEKFDALIADRDLPWKLRDILPHSVCAGQIAGTLTEEGARFLDPSGSFRPGALVAPCEGDAGTGMVATNAVRARTGNVSAGTSAFSMLVSDHPLGIHPEVDMVTTPAGLPVAMVHSSNCTSDINAWVELLFEFAGMLGVACDKGELYTMLFNKALEGSVDGGGLLSYNYFSGEGVTRMNKGRPVFARLPDAELNMANFMRTHLLSALTTMKIGLDILAREENLTVDRLLAHGGFFKTPGVGQRILSAAARAPIAVMQTAGEGGPYGMALLCAYMLWHEEGESLEDYLDNKVFASAPAVTVMATQEEIDGFEKYAQRYLRAFDIEKIAAETL